MIYTWNCKRSSHSISG